MASSLKQRSNLFSYKDCFAAWLRNKRSNPRHSPWIPAWVGEYEGRGYWGRSEFFRKLHDPGGGSVSCKFIMALFGSVRREEFRADSDTDLCIITDLQATAEIVDMVHGFQVVESKGNQM